MSKIEDINKSEHDKIMLRDVKVKKIYSPRFVKTKFDKDKDAADLKKGKTSNYTTGIRNVIIEDETGEIIYEEWNPKDDLKEGDEVEFINARTKFDDYRNEYHLVIFKKKENAQMINRTALDEGRADGNYLREGGNVGGATTVHKKIDKDELKIAIAEGIQPIIDLLNENHAAQMNQVKEAMKKIQGKASKKEE
jgi:hypothetical protein